MIRTPVKSKEIEDDASSCDSLCSDGSVYSSSDGALFKNPIDIPKQVRVVSLCLNRVLQEPGLTAMVQGYYKGGLEEDVWNRLCFVTFFLYCSTEINDDVKAFYQEYLGYIQYYSDNIFFMQTMMSKLPLPFEEASLPVRNGLVMEVFDTLASSLRDHTKELVHHFLSFLHGQVEHSDFRRQVEDPPTFSEWNTRLIEKLVSSGAVDVLLEVGNTMIPFVDFNDFEGSYNFIKGMAIVLSMVSVHSRAFGTYSALGELETCCTRLLALSTDIQATMEVMEGESDDDSGDVEEAVDSETGGAEAAQD